jgi:DNA polymerase-3 subunit alpha
MIDFVPLHVHSHFSLDGLSPTSRLLDVAKSKNFPALALTDHGTLSGSIEFVRECSVRDIKPLLGMESYVMWEDNRYHLTLLADGNRGFSSLIKINNEGVLSSDPERPSVNWESLFTHTDGLVVLSGCAASPLQRTPLSTALSLGRRLKDAFGNNFLAEGMLVGSSLSQFERACQLASALSVKLVITNDTHFPIAEDAAVHRVATKMRSGFDYQSSDLFLATPEELKRRFGMRSKVETTLIENAMHETAVLARRLSPVTFDATPKLPRVPKANETLRIEVAKWLLGRPEEYQKRAEYELDVITSLGFSAYFLILTDIVRWARKQGIRVGPGRGSAVGSLVAWALGLTEVNPIEYNLSFDRFLNVKRKEFPDIDTDFESERRDEVLEYTKKRWKGIPIATPMRWNEKSLIHDLAKHYRMPRDMEEKAADEGENSDAFKEMMSRSAEMSHAYEAMKGQVRHVGKHAAGIVFSGAAEVPLVRVADGSVAAGWAEGENRELADAGIVKIDLLGLSALSILNRLEKDFGHRAPDPVDDDPTFDLFCHGKTVGVFQFDGSQGIISFTQEVKPRTFSDLVAINALYRPGALDSGAAAHYPEWRMKPRLLHPLIDDLLNDTGGIFVYQEQVMAAYARVVGGDLADADLARRVFAKARPGQPDWEEKMYTLRATFQKGCVAHDIDEATSNKIWSEIVTSTRYSFNRSHAVAYSRIAWDLAWWKQHHSAAFYATSLSVEAEDAQRYLYEAVEFGVKVVTPHVNRSTSEYAYDNETNTIYLPLTSVMHLGNVGVDAILAARPFSSLPDFEARVPRRAVTAAVREGLLALGAFDGIPGAFTVDKKRAPVDLGGLSSYERQLKYMGYALPTLELVELVDREKKKDRCAGVVYAKETRHSEYGAYVVYRLLPTGTFWHRGSAEWPVGALVSVKIHKGNGKLLNATVLGGEGHV